MFASIRSGTGRHVAGLGAGQMLHMNTQSQPGSEGKNNVGWGTTFATMHGLYTLCVSGLYGYMGVIEIILFLSVYQ